MPGRENERLKRVACVGTSEETRRRVFGREDVGLKRRVCLSGLVSDDTCVWAGEETGRLVFVREKEGLKRRV